MTAACRWTAAIVLLFACGGAADQDDGDIDCSKYLNYTDEVANVSSRLAGISRQYCWLSDVMAWWVPMVHRKGWWFIAIYHVWIIIKDRFVQYMGFNDFKKRAFFDAAKLMRLVGQNMLVYMCYHDEKDDLYLMQNDPFWHSLVLVMLVDMGFLFAIQALFKMYVLPLLPMTESEIIALKLDRQVEDVEDDESEDESPRKKVYLKEEHVISFSDPSKKEEIARAESSLPAKLRKKSGTYQVGESAEVLRSNGSWSPCIVKEIKKDGNVIVTLPGGGNEKEICQPVLQMWLRSAKSKKPLPPALRLSYNQYRAAKAAEDIDKKEAAAEEAAEQKLEEEENKLKKKGKSYGEILAFEKEKKKRWPMEEYLKNAASVDDQDNLLWEMETIYVLPDVPYLRVTLIWLSQTALFNLYILVMNQLGEEQVEDGKPFAWLMGVLIMCTVGEQQAGEPFDFLGWIRVWQEGMNNLGRYDEKNKDTELAWDASVWIPKLGMAWRCFCDWTVNSLYRQVLLSTTAILLSTEGPLDFVKDVLAIVFISTLDDPNDDQKQTAVHEFFKHEKAYYTWNGRDIKGADKDDWCETITSQQTAMYLWQRLEWAENKEEAAEHEITKKQRLSTRGLNNEASNKSNNRVRQARELHPGNGVQAAELRTGMAWRASRAKNSKSFDKPLLEV